MKRGLVALLVVSAVLVAATLVVAFYRPARPADSSRREELHAAITRANAYYDFEHYDRAADTFRLAAERGMEGGADWYRYARAVELSKGLSLDLYFAAFGRLMAEGSDPALLSQAEALLGAHAEPLDYGKAREGGYRVGAFLTVTGTISRITWGRVESGVDLLQLDTAESRWMHRVGDPVLVAMPRHRQFRTGETITFMARYEGVARVEDGAGLTRVYPSLTAVGARLTAGP